MICDYDLKNIPDRSEVNGIVVHIFYRIKSSPKTITIIRNHKLCNNQFIIALLKTFVQNRSDIPMRTVSYGLWRRLSHDSKSSQNYWFSKLRQFWWEVFVTKILLTKSWSKSYDVGDSCIYSASWHAHKNVWVDLWLISYEHSQHLHCKAIAWLLSQYTGLLLVATALIEIHITNHIAHFVE